MSGQVEVGSGGGGNPQANDSNISQAVMDQFLSNGMMQMSSSPSASSTAAPSMRGRDYNLPPPGCDIDTIKLFVGSIPPKYTQEHLRPYFAQIGEVVEISVLEGRGSGFVWFKTREQAERAIRELDGKKPGIDPKEEHRPLEIRQARLKNDPYGALQNSNFTALLQLMTMMQSSTTPNFQNIFSAMGDNPTLMIQFIDVMLQQHQQQTQFLQQMRDTICKMNNVGSSPVNMPFASGPPSAPGLNVFGINNSANGTNNGNLARRSVDNHIPSDRGTLNSPVAKRTSLDISNMQNGNGALHKANSTPNTLNPNQAFMSMLFGQANGNGMNNNTDQLSLLMNGMNLNGSMNGNGNGFNSNGFGGLEALMQVQNGVNNNGGGLNDLSKALLQSVQMNQQGFNGMGMDQNNLLASMFAQNFANGNVGGFRSSSPLVASSFGLSSNGMIGFGDSNGTIWSEGLNARRSMESVPENGSKGELEGDYKDSGEGLLRQILEENVSDGSQENHTPVSAPGYDTWGGQPTVNHC